jgi:Ig-like domain CHU_C associated/Domain of unknown function (DUF2341)/SprB repeat
VTTTFSMTKRFYQILPFVIVFSFPLTHTLAQRLSPVLENRVYSEQESKLFDASKSATPLTYARTSALAVTASVTDATCYGSTAGKITYTISGGTPPYTYQWSNGVSGSVYGNCFYTLQINNPGVTTLTDYQVLVTLPYAPASGMKADFSNVSFADTNNTASYAFWKESSLNKKGVFWIKLPTFPPGNSFVRVSFCTNSSTSLSNGTATFDHFDDFDDQDFSDWTHVCKNVNYPDEQCDAVLEQVNGTDYSVKLDSYAHCVGTTTVGVNNELSKTVNLPNGQYWADVSVKFLVCLRTICTDSARVISRIYANNAFYSAFFLQKNGACGCSQSGWTQIRGNGPLTYASAPVVYDLRTEVTDCAEGEIQYDNFRLRKWYVDPVVTIDVPKTLSLSNLAAGDYTLEVTDGDGVVSKETYTVSELSAPQVTEAVTCGQSPASLTASGPYAAFEWYDSPSAGNSIYQGASYTADSLDQDQLFYVAGVGPGACQSMPRTPAKITVLFPENTNGCLTIYTGISPNGDGLNEAWEINGIEAYPHNKVLGKENQTKAYPKDKIFPMERITTK